MSKSFEIIVGGLVQGVGYRSYVARTAKSLNLKGSVKNMYDGNVRVIAVGEEANVKEFLDLLKTGPVRSSVKSLDCRELDAAANYEDFRIVF